MKEKIENNDLPDYTADYEWYKKNIDQPRNFVDRQAIINLYNEAQHIRDHHYNEGEELTALDAIRKNVGILIANRDDDMLRGTDNRYLMNESLGVEQFKANLDNMPDGSFINKHVAPLLDPEEIDESIKIARVTAEAVDKISDYLEYKNESQEFWEEVIADVKKMQESFKSEIKQSKLLEAEAEMMKDLEAFGFDKEAQMTYQEDALKESKNEGIHISEDTILSKDDKLVFNVKGYENQFEIDMPNLSINEIVSIPLTREDGRPLSQEQQRSFLIALGENDEFKQYMIDNADNLSSPKILDNISKIEQEIKDLEIQENNNLNQNVSNNKSKGMSM